MLYYEVIYRAKRQREAAIEAATRNGNRSGKMNEAVNSES
jgi:hypothetical protein